MSWKLPTKTDYMKAQMEHEQTREYAQQIHEIVKEIKPDYKTALEIGAAWGVSALSILLAGKGHLTSVDSNLSIKAPREIEANDLNDRWVCTYQRSESFWLENESTFDIVYIDGSHLYEDARNDFFNGWEALNEGGLFMVDDYIHEDNQKVDLPEDNPPYVMYGISLALWELVYAKQIKQIGTRSHIFYAIKHV